MSSYSYHKLTKKLKTLGYRFYRHGKGSHELWVCDNTQKVVPVQHHGSRDIRSGTLHAILRQIGLQNIKELDEI